MYQEIGSKQPGEESEGEEADLAELGHIDELLEKFDPDFNPDELDEDEKALRGSIIYRLAHGARANEQPPPRTKEEKAAWSHQLHLNVERVRIPEVLFQPGIVGLDQAGIVEIIGAILKGIPPDQQEALVDNVLLTGTHVQYPGLRERLEAELRAIRPVGSSLNVRVASNPRMDAWKGAALWAATKPEELKAASMTREQWLEAGEDYLKEWAYSNRR